VRARIFVDLLRLSAYSAGRIYEHAVLVPRAHRLDLFDRGLVFGIALEDVAQRKDGVLAQVYAMSSVRARVAILDWLTRVLIVDDRHVEDGLDAAACADTVLDVSRSVGEDPEKADQIALDEREASRRGFACAHLAGHNDFAKHEAR
jgi:hypothetical protein